MQCSLRDISIFVAAYEERSFTAAAQRENATQSGVSQHMRNLEYLLGVQLFLRERGGVMPTPAAASFYRNCLQVLRAQATAQSEIARFAQSTCGELRVGLMPTMTARVLAPALDAFITQSPNVVVQIVEGYSATLTQMVQAGDLDFAIVPAFGGAPGTKTQPFLRTPETLITRAGTGRAPLSPVNLRDLGPLKLVLPGISNTRRQTIEAYCASNEIAIAQIVGLDAMLGTLDFVAQTDWVAVLPALMMEPRSGARGLSVHPITGPGLYLDLMLIEPARRPMSPQAEQFIDLLEVESTRLGNLWDEVAPGVSEPSVRLVPQNA